MKKVALLAIIVSIFLSPMALSAKDNPEVKWKLQTCFPSNDLAMRLLPKFTEMVKQKSNGRMVITSFPGGELVKVQDTLEAGGRGMVDMVYSVGAFWKGSIPAADVDFGLPCSWRDGYEVHSIFNSGLRDVMRDAYRDHGLYYLSEVPYGHWILMLNKPVKKLEDFAGMKLRAIGTAEELLVKMGVTPVYIAPPEVYTSLQLGTIDGCGFSAQAWDQMNFKEVCKYYVKPGLMFVSGNLLVNTKRWNALPDDLKNVVELSALSYIRDVSSAFIAQERLIEAKIEKDRLMILPQSEVIKMRKIALSVWEKIAQKSAISEKAVKIVKDYLKDNGVLDN